MERSEPSLVPEWLRCGTGNSSSVNQFASSLRSDGISLRNRSLRSVNGKDNPRATSLDRSNSSGSRRSSGSNGSSKHPYSSFNRSHREKEKEKSVGRERWDLDCSDPLGNILLSRVEKNTLRRSHSMVTGKPCEMLSRREVESKSGGNANHNGIGKSVFEKDFPSLGTDEKQGVTTIGRVSSPVSRMSAQNLPILAAHEGWTSALAEVPAIVSSGSMGVTPVQLGTVAAPSSIGSSTMAGINMAEALSQDPIHASTTPQLPDRTQRLEELAIKQSRQLIPMTPPTPKPLVLNSSDRSKHLKTGGARTSETIVAKNPQQQLANQSPRAGQVRSSSDVQKTSNVGKFHILKPVWENGISSVPKDMSGSIISSDKLANIQQPARPLSPTLVTGPHHPNVSGGERKAAALGLNHFSNMEKKRCSISQSQSRSDFFNLMRKKTSVNASSTILADSGPGGLSPVIENSSQLMDGDVGDHVSPRNTTTVSQITANSDPPEDDDDRLSSDGEKNVCLNGAVPTDEEEAAFLRSLGWEENAGEDEGLTEEEINAFYQEYMKLKPSMKLCKEAERKFSFLVESREPNLKELH